MKTILYVYHASNIGGGSYAMLNIIKALDRTKYKPVVLLKDAGPLTDELQAMGIEVHLLPLINTVPYNSNLFTLRNIKRVVNIKRSFKKFADLLLKIKPDIVYLNTMMLHPYLKIAKGKGVKTIIHVREHWPENEHTIQRNYAISNIRKFADHIVAINKFSAAMVADDTHHPTIVYDWIDMEKRFQTMPYSEILGEDCTDKKVYLCTGGFDPFKGTLEIVRAYSETIEDPESRLLILGNTPQNNKPKGIRRFLKKKNNYTPDLLQAIENDNRIKLIPNTYFVTHIYQQAYCVLSYFTIPHANLALAENVMLQTPVIAANNEEAIEYSNNGELAILFEANNIIEFKKKLLEFDKERTGLKERLSQKAAVIANLFNPQRNIETLESVYDKVCQK